MRNCVEKNALESQSNDLVFQNNVLVSQKKINSIQSQIKVKYRLVVFTTLRTVFSYGM